MLVVVKCGSDMERLAGEGKPGNRGKRDSQMILTNFIMRVNYNERFTPLDFDLFRKVYTLCGVHADYFEAVLMVSLLVLIYIFRAWTSLTLRMAGRRRHPSRS
jgi:chitin synthase